MAKTRPSVFVGSSAEGLPYALGIQAELDRECECVLWHQGVFGLSQGGLESLCRRLPTFDFGVLVLTPDDLVVSRGEERAVPRDNVLLEFGMCVGALGRERTFLVVDRSAELRLPSDLAGVTPATFQPPGQGTFQSAVGSACTMIRAAVQALGPRNPTLPVEISAGAFQNIRREHGVTFFVENVGTKELPPFRVMIAHPGSSYHLFHADKGGPLLPGQKRAFHCVVLKDGQPVPHFPRFEKDLRGEPLDDAADALFSFQLVLDDSDKVLYENHRIGRGIVAMLRRAVVSTDGGFGTWEEWSELHSESK